MKLELKLDMFRVLAAVADAGGLAEAAARLGRTAPALSMTLKQFEAHLGAALFEPGRKNRLTPVGRRALGEARAVLAAHDRAVRAIAGVARGDAGEVRVAAVPSVAAALLPGVLAAFRAAHPGVRVELRDMDSASVRAALADGRADLGLASGAPGRGLLAEPLFSDPFGVVCRADHPLAEGRGPVGWQELAPYAVIANGLAAAIGDPALDACLARARLCVHNTHSLLAMVRAGLGVTVLPRLALREAGGGLAFRPAADPAARRQTALMRPAGQSPSPAAAALAGALRAAARGLGGAAGDR
jgi:DNA-binding transcriptional LysR family regulator